MADQPDTPEHIRIAAEQQDLGRALELFPEMVKAAAERGLRPLGAPPKGVSSTATPAAVFDPARFETDR